MKTITKMFVLAFSVCLYGCANSCAGPMSSDNKAGAQDAVPEKAELKILQLNLWKECTNSPDAENSLVDQIYYLNPDVATFCELYKGGNSSVTVKLIADLKARGREYYVKRTDGRAVISKYPIVETGYVNKWSFKAVLDVYGQRVAVYPAHSEYRYYSCYYPRGYNDGVSSWDELPEPITDIAKIVEVCSASDRVASAKAFVASAKEEIAKDALVFYAGDFNEPSHLDWTEATADLFDHNGCVVPWPLSEYLVNEVGYIDSYREKYPDPATYPGITFPSACPGMSPKDISWAPKADERDRIDMIYYYPDARLSLKDVYIAGPAKSIADCQEVAETGRDVFVMDKDSGWPSDHKGVLAIFEIKLK